jgi:hypothetical protein
MSAAPKPAIREGVKGHIITVEEHKKFVPVVYKGAKKK